MVSPLQRFRCSTAIWSWAIMPGPVGNQRELNMKRLMLLSTALIFSATLSMAAVTADELVTAYQADGYTKIEVKTGLTQIKVEAVKGTTKVEVIYDAATGAILDQETGRARRGDRGTGVEISSEARDFLKPGHSRNSSADDSSADDSSADDSGADDHGSDDGQHDANDDHGDDHDGDHGGNDDGADRHGKGKGKGNDD
jgi:hypothetical protein